MLIENKVSVGCLLACAASLASAQSSVDRSFKTTAQDCAAVEWSERALATYPTIASACQAVEERNGVTYVKFQGTVKRVEEQGRRLTVDFKDGGEIVLSPPPETRVYVDGRKTPVGELQRGDELNFRIAEDRLAAQFPETESATARFVIVPIVTSQAAAGEPLAATLPATAGLLPMLALWGCLVLGVAAVLAMGRRPS